MDQTDLALSSHPVSWLRVQFLIARARRLDYAAVADEIEKHWSVIASSLNISEDYFGYFEKQWTSTVESCLDDMLTETAPRRSQNAENIANADYIPDASPILLMNRAWKIARENPTQFHDWEKKVIEQFLA